MNYESNHFNSHPDRLPEIEARLYSDGYVRIQFDIDEVPREDVETFFVDVIEQLGGECVTHNQLNDSIVWHVRPMNPDQDLPLARSQTDQEFSFHTDCSYESDPPEFMALFVLEPDRYGGGELEILRVAELIDRLSPSSREFLKKKKFSIEVPLEFRKSPTVDQISESILIDDERIRYRTDILAGEQCEELLELKSIIERAERYRPKLDRYTLIIVNNHKYLHGRTKILDGQRHLLRIRFNRASIPYRVFSIYDRTKLRPDSLTFSNQFYRFLQDEHHKLHRALTLIVEQYDQPTPMAEEIRQTFRFDERVDRLLRELNRRRPNFRLGSYRPDLLLSEGTTFRINGQVPFQPKICEINARFTVNGYFLSAGLCSSDPANRLSKDFSTLIDDLLQSFDRNKPMFVLKSKENGFDIHLFVQFWRRQTSQPCLFVDPKDLKIENGQLVGGEGRLIIEQCLLELHQEEILDLSDEILQFFVDEDGVNYLNDLRTIFLLHDKRLFSLLSNESFLYALDKHSSLSQCIPKTFVIRRIPDYLREAMIEDREHWCIKPNGAGKGENVTIGGDVSLDQWIDQLTNAEHQEWIVQEYQSYASFESMNLVGMLICVDARCYSMGLIRMSPEKIVNICHGGAFSRCFIPLEYQHTASDGHILSKEELHRQLLALKSFDPQWNRHVYLSSSGGTGGKNLYFTSDIQENQLQRRLLVELMLEKSILSSNDVCLNLFQSGNVYRSMEIFTDFCSLANCTSIPMGAMASDEKVLQSIEYFQPNVLMGMPFRLLQLAKYLDEHSQREIRFEKIFFAGEPLESSKEKFLQRMFHSSVCLGFYGSAETGVFACQSRDYASTKVYLYPRSLVEIEIIAEQIVVTNRIRRRNQLVRFNTGDHGRLLPLEGPTGLLEVFRSDRLILLDADVLTRSDLEAILSPLNLLEWQLVITEPQETLLSFRFLPPADLSPAIVEERITCGLRECLTGGAWQTIRCEYRSVSIGDFLRNDRSYKLMKIIDRRS